MSKEANVSGAKWEKGKILGNKDREIQVVEGFVLWVKWDAIWGFWAEKWHAVCSILKGSLVLWWEYTLGGKVGGGWVLWRLKQ